MMNHLEPIDMAMVKAIHDGAQTQIGEFSDLREKELDIDQARRGQRVKSALATHKAYRNKKGVKKI